LRRVWPSLSMILFPSSFPIPSIRRHMSLKYDSEESLPLLNSRSTIFFIFLFITQPSGLIRQKDVSTSASSAKSWSSLSLLTYSPFPWPFLKLIHSFSFIFYSFIIFYLALTLSLTNKQVSTSGWIWVRLMYLRVYDSHWQHSSYKTAPSPSVCYSITHELRSFGFFRVWSSYNLILWDHWLGIVLLYVYPHNPVYKRCFRSLRFRV
jgi:hypothetical protein